MSKPTGKAFVKVEGLGKTYKGSDDKAIDEVTFDVSEGEIFGLIGPDGAGKSTIFRIMATLLLADKGRVIVDGINVVQQYKHIRKIIGYMPGRFSLYQDLSVHENLRLFARIYGTTIAQQYDQIKDIYSQIEPFKDRKAGQLSGGMKQKLALSCALVHSPRLLILDEPTTGVDPVSRREFWDMLAKLRSRGITVVVSTPYMDEASRCDRIGLIQNGRMMTVDTPQAVVAAFPTRLFSVKAEKRYATMRRLQQMLPGADIHLFGDSIHVSNRQQELNEQTIRSRIQNETTEEVEVEEIKAGIEDCFLTLMNEKVR